jgi:hypothetical protein
MTLFNESLLLQIIKCFLVSQSKIVIDLTTRFLAEGIKGLFCILDVYLSDPILIHGEFRKNIILIRYNVLLINRDLFI